MAENATALWKRVSDRRPDIILLDLGLPDIDGLELLAVLRERYGNRLGTVVCSARGQIDDRVSALSLRADQYLVKPVHLPELVLILQQLADRLPRTRVETWALWPNGRRLQLPSGELVTLTGTEYRLLAELAQAEGMIRRETLYLNVIAGATPRTIDYRRLDTLVSRLRSKIQRETGCALPLETFRGQGYQFSAPLVEETISIQPQAV